MAVELKDTIAIYSAILSSILAIRAIRSENRRVQILIEHGWDANPEQGVDIPKVTFSITNPSKRPIIIDKVIVEKYSENEKPIETILRCEYNVRLTQSECHRIDACIPLDTEGLTTIYDYGDVNNDKIPDDKKQITVREYSHNKLRLLVVDTTGKKYKSKWVHLRDKRKSEFVPSFIHGGFSYDQ